MVLVIGACFSLFVCVFFQLWGGSAHRWCWCWWCWCWWGWRDSFARSPHPSIYHTLSNCFDVDIVTTLAGWWTSVLDVDPAFDQSWSEWVWFASLGRAPCGASKHSDTLTMGWPGTLTCLDTDGLGPPLTLSPESYLGNLWNHDSSPQRSSHGSLHDGWFC